jgi:hypothetical protein
MLVTLPTGVMHFPGTGMSALVVMLRVILSLLNPMNRAPAVVRSANRVAFCFFLI